MKRIQLPRFDFTRYATPQFAENFPRCGLNADWATDAFHLSLERFTGHKPNTTSGDFYLIRNEDFEDGWLVVIRTLADERTDSRSFEQTDLISEVVALTSAEMWTWLSEPENQELYLRVDETAADALNATVTALVQAIEESGFSVAGPTNHRACEHGEPKWVCVAREAIADAHRALKLKAEVLS